MIQCEKFITSSKNLTFLINFIPIRFYIESYIRKILEEYQNNKFGIVTTRDTHTIFTLKKQLDTPFSNKLINVTYDGSE